MERGETAEAVNLWPVGMRLRRRGYRLATEVVDEVIEALGAQGNKWYTQSSPYGGPICPASALVFQPARFPDRVHYGSRFVLQTTTEWEFFRPMFPMQTVFLDWRCADRWTRRGKEHVKFEMPVSNGSGELLALCRFSEALFDPPAYDPPLPNRDDEPPAKRLVKDGVEWGFLSRVFTVRMSECLAGKEPNWHTDLELARQKGFDRIPLLGAQLVALLIELLTRIGGTGFLEGGKLLVNNLRPVYIDERVTARATEHRRFSGPDGQPMIEFAVWCERDDGELLLAGYAAMPLKAEPQRIVDLG